MNTVNETLRGLKYALHVMMHPFDGFWDLKHEKRGNVRSAVLILILLSIMTAINASTATGFIVNYNDPSHFSAFREIAALIAPFCLWCVSNWCITTLLDGEGSMKDIMITTAYALSPYLLFSVPTLLLSHLITVEEAAFYYLIFWVPIIWTALLLFIGIMTLHQFTILKTLATMIIAVIGMLIIIFLTVLFASVLQMALSYIYFISKEISIRR